MVSAPAVLKQGWKEAFQGVKISWHLTRAARVILLKCKSDHIITFLKTIQYLPPPVDYSSTPCHRPRPYGRQPWRLLWAHVWQLLPHSSLSSHKDLLSVPSLFALQVFAFAILFASDGFLPQHYGAALKTPVKCNTRSLEWAFSEHPDWSSPTLHRSLNPYSEVCLFVTLSDTPKYMFRDHVLVTYLPVRTEP